MIAFVAAIGICVALASEPAPNEKMVIEYEGRHASIHFYDGRWHLFYDGLYTAAPSWRRIRWAFCSMALHPIDMECR